MNDTQTKINSLLELIEKNKGQCIFDSEKLRSFIVSAVNGDPLIESLMLNATLSKDREGLLIYILTSSKIVKIEIDNQGFNSMSNYLSQVVGINRGLIKDENGNSFSKLKIEFSQGSFGLNYPEGTTKIDSFFSKFDEELSKTKKA